MCSDSKTASSHAYCACFSAAGFAAAAVFSWAMMSRRPTSDLLTPGISCETLDSRADDVITSRDTRGEGQHDNPSSGNGGCTCVASARILRVATELSGSTCRHKNCILAEQSAEFEIKHKLALHAKLSPDLRWCIIIPQRDESALVSVVTSGCSRCHGWRHRRQSRPRVAASRRHRRLDSARRWRSLYVAASSSACLACSTPRRGYSCCRDVASSVRRRRSTRAASGTRCWGGRCTPSGDDDSCQEPDAGSTCM